MSGPLQRRTGQNSYPLLATQSLQHTHTHKSVNMHTHTQRHTQLLCTQTHFPVGHLICQVSIWPQVVMKLEAVARILVAGSYMMKLLF